MGGIESSARRANSWVLLRVVVIVMAQLSVGRRGGASNTQGYINGANDADRHRACSCERTRAPPDPWLGGLPETYPIGHRSKSGRHPLPESLSQETQGQLASSPHARDN